ncbi:MAG: VOC family protein [Spirochaetia bacterium]|nr:VOC family protein [Spirochaetia bacterium]
MILVEGLHHISLGSSNLKRSIAFYRDLLDFELVEEEAKHAVVRLDPISIRLNVLDGYKARVENPGETSLSFILDVDDFTDAIQELEDKTVAIIKGPVQIEGGEAVLIADPDGNLIELFYRE